MKNNRQIITCPKCGAQYLPSEIFMPRSFIGEPKDIEKDCYGKIVYYAGTDMNLKESYLCDYCGHNIRVEATVEFRNIGDNKKFQEETVIRFNNKVSMPET